MIQQIEDDIESLKEIGEVMSNLLYRLNVVIEGAGALLSRLEADVKELKDGD